MFRTAMGFGLAVISATLAASVLQTQVKLAMLEDAGAKFALTVRLEETVADLLGLAATYGAIIAIGFLIAFPVAWVARRVLGAPGWFAYGLAGGVALGVALALMKMMFEITPIGGARGHVGLALQVVAGVLGGLVFSALAAKPAR